MRPGRPRCPRRIETEPVVSYFKPRGVPLRDLEVILLSLEELEAVRLSDLEGLDQEEAARRMGISRRALWEDLQNARKKIVEALVKGKAIEIKGGNYTVVLRRRYVCKGCQAKWQLPTGIGEPQQCPICGNKDINVQTDEIDHYGPTRDCQSGCCRDR